MPTTVIVGAQWGDEGKAKVLDALMPETDVVVRHQGGANAGHTVVVGEERYAFHLVPSGILHEDKTCVVAGGCVVDPMGLADEIEALRRRGVKIGPANLRFSERAHLVMPYHKLLDNLSEKLKEKSGGGKIGTTGRGIGPAYMDKVARSGLRAVDLRDAEHFRRRVRARVGELNLLLTAVYEEKPLDADAVADEVLARADVLRPLLADTAAELNAALKKGRRVLFEGAQGAMLDIDHGTYPFVTSSNSTAGGAATGAGVSPTWFENVLGIAKAYTTRVGGGPFPTELEDEIGSRLRERGHEFGTTTGRPRRCGWFDVVAVRYAIEVSGINVLALTKLDVLSGEESIALCTGYRLNGKTLTCPPALNEEYEAVEPVYETVPGWRESLEEVRSFEELPEAARAYVEHLESLLEVPVRYVGVGPSRTALIRR